MKRLIVSILAIVYLGLSSGAIVHMHFCMGKLVGSSLVNQEQSGVCNKCGMQKKATKNKCCKDEQKIVKLEQDQKITNTVDPIIALTSLVALPNHFILPAALFSTSIEETYLSNSPPLAYTVPIYLRNRSFRI